MSYKCYVFGHANALINGLQEYKQKGGSINDVKVLIRDVDHGQALSAAGLHHIDYLNQITSANHRQEELQHTNDRPLYFVGLTTNQTFPGVISGSYADDDTNALEALSAYGLLGKRARQALDSLRMGHLLLFVPQEEVGNRYHTLHETLAASFGEEPSSASGDTISGAMYTFYVDE